MRRLAILATAAFLIVSFSAGGDATLARSIVA